MGAFSQGELANFPSLDDVGCAKGIIASMKACALTQLVGGVAMMTVFTVASCGGGQTPPAESPTPSSSETDKESLAASEAETNDPDGSEEGSASASDSEAEPAEEGRSTEAIAKIIKDNRKPFRACYEATQKDIPNLQGSMTIKFVLDAEGGVKSAELNPDRSEIKATSIVTCAIAELKKLKFPPHEKGMETTVNYPFNFKP